MKLATVVIAAVACALVTVEVSAVDELVSGKVTVIRPGTLAKFVSRSTQQPGQMPFTLPMPGSTGDPTINGATLTYADVGGMAGSATYALDASGWKGLGSPPGSRGYRYKGRDDAVDLNPKGTCRSVRIGGTVIKGVCRDDVPFSTPFGDAESVVLEMGSGSGSLRYCAEFGGEETKNDTEAMQRR